MSVPGLMFYMVFGGNVLFSSGLFWQSGVSRTSRWLEAALFSVIASVVAVMMGLLYRFVLSPSGLETITPVLMVFLLLLVMLAATVLTRFVPGMEPLSGYLGSVAALRVPLVIYAAALLAGGRFWTPATMAIGAGVAIAAYVAATLFLDNLVQRLELEPIPAAFRGEPVRLLSAGLVALAFSGVETAFFGILYI